MITVWITKYALTQGILKMDAEICEGPGLKGTMIQTKSRFPTYFHKPFWHTTPEEAVNHARLLQEKAAKSLAKKLVKLTKMRFVV